MPNATSAATRDATVTVRLNAGGDDAPRPTAKHRQPTGRDVGRMRQAHGTPRRRSRKALARAGGDDAGRPMAKSLRRTTDFAIYRAIDVTFALRF